MAITLETIARNAACNAVVDLVDVGTVSYLQMFATAAPADTLVEITLPDPAFGAAVAGVATAQGLPLTGTCIEGGILGGYRIEASAGTVWSGTIGTSGADMIVDNTTIVLGQAITITAWTHTHPA